MREGRCPSRDRQNPFRLHSYRPAGPQANRFYSIISEKSASSSAKVSSADSTGSGVDISTPATFNSSMGDMLPPKVRNLR